MIFKRTAKKWIEFTVRLIIVDNVICIHKQFRAQSGKGKDADLKQFQDQDKHKLWIHTIFTWDRDRMQIKTRPEINNFDHVLGK